MDALRTLFAQMNSSNTEREVSKMLNEKNGLFILADSDCDTHGVVESVLSGLAGIFFWH